ncbi:E3 ubiquitin-protein ligase TRIM21-like [Genypterus blacodes]|uniref:E3 ubiquitin-protein ligase TRIM21-like n=1 Tax=Genypterus blacodes TaxID=154954 RepID=UPI003F7603E7
MASMMSEDNFLCSICLEVFTKPVAIPCGHNFCLKCITNYWNTNVAKEQCPLCKEQFYPRPMLRVNIFIADMAAKFVKSCPGMSRVCPDEEPAKPGSVLCDICTGAKLTALKSCLVCLTSYCAIHLERHQSSLVLKKHKLIDPLDNLESRICKKHDMLLELFCKTDLMPVCESCRMNDHKSHEVVTVQEEAQSQKADVIQQKTHFRDLIQVRRQKIDEIQHVVETGQVHAGKVTIFSRDVMNALVDYITRSQKELKEVIESKQKKIEAQAESLIEELEEEIMKIEQKNKELDQISLTDDDLKFLESFLSITITPLKVKDCSEVKLDGYQCNVHGAVAKLEMTVTREIRMLCDPDLTAMQQHAVNVTFDPDTANPFLTVSEDGKQVRHGDRRRNVPNKANRFDHVLNVMATEGFSSGKFYYETRVKDKTQWDLGVAKESINRKGDIRLSPRSGYWTIWLRNGNEFTANTSPSIILPLREKPEKVGVFVDYEEGQVSFYDVEARAHIYSFTGFTFTEKLFPFFSPSGNEGGKNSAPLIITPVNS